MILVAKAVRKPHAERQPHDQYYTPEPLARAICRSLASIIDTPVENILEPSAGTGVFMRTMQETWPEARVEGVDIAPKAEDILQRDFAEEERAGWDLIGGNPSFRLAEEHVWHALSLLRPGGFLSFLLPTTFIAGIGRAILYEQHPLRFFQPIAGRPSFTVDEGNGSQEFAVFTWKKGWQQNGELLPPLKWKPEGTRKPRRSSTPPLEEKSMEIMQPTPDLMNPTVAVRPAAPLHVTRLTSSIQEGIDVMLGHKTLVYGPNASGKSMITRALRLALAASASNLGGRALVSRGLDLLPLVGADEDLVSKAYLSDGTEARFRVKNKHAGKKRSASVEEFVTPQSVGPDVFPLDSLKAALLGKPEALRKFILAKSGVVLTRKDILERIGAVDKALIEAYDSMAARVATQIDRGDEVGYLLAIQAKARDLAAEVKKEAKVKTTVADESGQGLPPPPTEAQLTAARAQLVAVSAVLEQVTGAKSATAAATSAVAAEHVANVQEVENRLAGLRLIKQQTGEALPFLQQQYTQAQKALETAQLALVQIDGQVDPMYANILRIARWQVKNNPGSCSCCGQQVPVTLFAERAQQLEDYLNKLDAQVKAGREQANKAFNEVKAGTITVKTNLDTCQKALTDATKAETTLIGVLAALQARAAAAQVPVPAGPSELPTEETARKAVADAQTVVAGLEQARGAWEIANKLRGSAATGEQKADQHKALADACDDVVASVLLAAGVDFERRVQTFLPLADKFGLQLLDGGREICRVGLWKKDKAGKDRLDVYLAGTEEVKLHIALAAALSDGPGKLAILTPDDRAWRPENLRAAMDAFTSTPQQVIIESPIMPLGGLPNGWTLVQR